MIPSETLKQCQDTLEYLAKSEINEPATDYSKLKNLLEIIEQVDIKRREAWDDEHFGESDQIANVIFDTDFSADDIPF